MQPNRALVFALMFSSVAFGSAALADPQDAEQRETGYSVFMDTRLPPTDLPAAPNPKDRVAVLDVLRRAPRLCANALLNDPQMDPLQELSDALRGLDLESDLVSTLGHIILTEDTLNDIPFDYAVLALVHVSRPNDRNDQRVILMVDQMAPIVAERLLGKRGSAKGLRDLRARAEVDRMLKPAVDSDALRGRTHGIRTSLEFQAARLNREDLVRPLAAAKAARATSP